MMLTEKIYQIIGQYYIKNKRKPNTKYIFKHKFILDGPFIIKTKNILKNKEPEEFKMATAFIEFYNLKIASDNLYDFKNTAIIFKRFKTYKNSTQFGMNRFDACINIKNIKYNNKKVKCHVPGMYYDEYEKINSNKPVIFDGIIFTKDIRDMMIQRDYNIYKIF